MAAAALTMRGGAVRDRAVVWSLLGHGVLVLVVLVGGFVIPRSPPLTRLAIKATVVDPNALRQPRASPAKPAPKAEPIPAPEPAPEPDPRIEQERIAKERQAEQKKQQEQKLALQREKDLQAKQQADKAKAQLAEKERQQKAAAERVKAEAERVKAEAERAKAARLKEEAARRAAAEAASKRDIARQLAEEERLLAAADSGALAEYVALIRQKVEYNWIRPASAKPGLECEVLVAQLPGGVVAGVRIGTCNADDAVRRSIEAAVTKASPLPLPDDSALFERNLRFIFKPEQ
jgi:colicin import membrane protein